MSNPVHDVAYFRAKFSAIPESKWCTDMYEDPVYRSHCALGHCGSRKVVTLDDCGDHHTKEGDALFDLFKQWVGTSFDLIRANDGRHELFPQKHPRARILAALDYIEAKQKEAQS